MEGRLPKKRLETAIERNDPSEFGSVLTNDIACTFAAAMVLRKYCVEYEFVLCQE